jgi:aryl-alcohol dehydrogenase-like predicted oxidoreductase
MYKEFGMTKLKTSPIVFGCMGSAGAFGSQDELDSIEAMRTAYEQGINFYDTAEAYGDGYSEQLLAKALGDKRKDIVIVSKVAVEHMGKKEIKEACERSLKNLKTDYLDMYLLHWPVDNVPVEERVEAMLQLKKDGKIRHFGVSNFGKQNLEEILPHAGLCANEIAYHLLFRACEFEVLPFCKEKAIPVLCYSSLMQGLLSGKYKSLEDFPADRARTRMFDSATHSFSRHGESGAEKEGAKALDSIWELVHSSGYSMEELAVGWLKAQPGVGGVIVGTRNAMQSKGFRKLLDVKLDQAMIDSLTKATDSLKADLGSNIDMWDHRPR